LLNSELETFESPETGASTAICEADFKLCLRSILKTHIKEITEQREENEALIEGL